MLIFAIDDERKLLQYLHAAIAEAAPEAEIRDFLLGQPALDAIREEGLRPDVVFSDIRMPGVTGLELAVRIRTLSPQTRIVFVTGYEEYALDAFQCRASGYVLKPVNAEKIRAELDALPPARLPLEPEKLTVRCFGYFEVFWQNKPLHFQRQQTKELFAYLISREGTICTYGEISTALWEEEDDMKLAGTRIRTLLHDLRTTLREIGMEDALIRHRSSIAVNCARIDCDFYRMRDGDMAAINSFNGDFMLQYSWAEVTTGMLIFNF
ncbi:MAG: response regulator [Oscillospiraceae bacterium]|nr:response regulator [Oscillospiraceae bacterium]